ncbi:MAG: YkgJ family cysteine cluster protein [Candidatus Omnitrophica bacterium]|nr:YkgJ family cysteine cluster protein [Candidatus Omnitrophota bacterium]
MGKKFYKNGLRFKCQGSSKCCKSGKIDACVYLTLKDRRQIATHLGLSTLKFTKQYTAKTYGKFHLKQTKHDCPFLRTQSCRIYTVRPLQCRAWPFWPENMKCNSWKKIKRSCNGIGKGRLYRSEEIDRIIKELNEQK